MVKFSKAFTRKIRLGRLGLPLWSLALAGVAVVAAAGQAVGPVLSGSVSGTAGLTVEQAVVLSTTAGAHTVAYTSGHTTDDALVVANDEGTSFTAAIELHAGDTVILKLDLDNVSDANANAILELSCPKGVDVEVEPTLGTAGISEAQMGSTTWLVKINTTATDTLGIILSPKDDLKPGFYTVSGRIVQITG